MSEEVKINVTEFESNIKSFQSVVSAIESSLKADYEFDKTNIKPFIEDLDITMKAIKLLKQYRHMLDYDIDTLNSVGEDMVENDERLAQASGPQPIAE